MRDDYLQAALKVIDDPNILVNVVSLRVKQLKRGNRALVESLEKLLPELMSLKPRGLREHLGLSKPIYARTSAYGHFGRTPDAEGGFSWEKTDLVTELKGAF